MIPPQPRLASRWHWPAMLLALCIAIGWNAAARAEDAAKFVGGQACAGCHADEAALWQGSHHALAMQAATADAVLGDFTGAKFEHFGVVTTFSRSGDKFMVRTDGPDGTLADFPIAYTFGVYPLQQYLIAMPGGRLQALGIAWDSRPWDQGGQRWFPLTPDRAWPAGDPLHWTGRDQTWNYMCAACHSTNLQKNFDLATNSYATTSSDVNVSCEACHGPGSRHLAWAQAQAPAQRPDETPAAGIPGGPPKYAHGMSEPDRMGLVAWLKATDTGHWEMNPDTGIARRSEKLASMELDTCATCHARRKVIAGDAAPGAPFLDSSLPSYLVPGAYHADGQIDGETFEYGSFVQSRMFQAGVTCSNCHEPHSLRLRANGNDLCGQCHLPAKFDIAEHSHHPTGSAGAQCVSCHMPAKTYMEVDARRDHAIRVPRPDLTLSIGTPNACSQCHADRPAEWAAQAVAAWYPHGRQTQPQYGTALQAGRTGAPDAERQLDALILDRTQPAIARGSALLLLRGVLSPASDSALAAAIGDAEPLVRTAAPRALPASPTPATVQVVAPLLTDPVRAVRVEAARALAGTAPEHLTQPQRAALEAADRELVDAEMIDADRPEAHLNLGLLDLRRRLADQADTEYRTALRLDPKFVPAMVNLADLDRMRDMTPQEVALLRQALALEPENAAAHYALGLAFARQHAYPAALQELRQASELAPDNARFVYTLAIALNSTGSPDEALDAA